MVISGVQILFRKLPLGFTVAYIPKANLDQSLLPEIDSACKQNHAIFLKLEPDSWANSPLPAGEGLGVRVSPP